MRSLRHKVWLSITAIVLLLLAGVAIVFERSAQQTADRVIENGLKRARLAIEQYERDVRARLIAVNGYVSGNSAFKAYMAEAIESGSRESLLDQFEEIKRFSDCDFMVVTDAEGTLVVDTTGSVEAESEQKLIEALSAYDEGAGSVSVLAFGPQLFHAVMSRVAVGEVVYGYVVIGYQIDDEAAAQFANLTDCGIVFAQSGGQARICAAALEGAPAAIERGALALELGQVGDQVANLTLGGEHLRVIAGPLMANSGKAMGRYVAMRSVDREMGPFHRMIRYALMIGGLFLVILIPLSFIVSSGVTRPLTQLTVAVDGLRQDQFQADSIEVKRKDEIGVLARAFCDLVQELREQRELVEFLEKASQKTVVAPSAEQEIISGGTLAPNTVLNGRYRIVEVLGRGGMGQVYRAHDMTLDEVVALKTLHIEDETLKESLKTETKLALRVTHKNVVRTFDLHFMQDLQFVTMEYVEGRTMRQALRGVERLPVSIASRIMRQVCLGLNAAHEAGVIHGDVKPDNVMIDNRGVVKVMDFGVARVAKLERGTRNFVTGTPVYMAPEQIMGEPMDARSDLYSVGIMLYQVFAGRLPFAGESTTQIFHGHLHQTPPLPSTFNPSIPQGLERIIVKSIHKKPEHRFQSLLEVEAAVAEAVG